MPVLVFLFAVVMLLAMPSTGAAQPSFPCTGSLDRTERAICRDRTLGALDRRMVSLYGAARERAARRGEGRDLVEAQRVWLRWRGTCGVLVGCIARRYQERMLDLVDLAQGPSRTGGTSAAPEEPKREWVNGKLQLTMPDGTVKILTDSGFVEVRHPDGRVEPAPQPMMAGRPDFPALPPEYAGWSQNLERDLVTIVEELLDEGSREGYADLYQHMDFPDRVDTHLRSISFLLGEQ